MTQISLSELLELIDALDYAAWDHGGNEVYSGTAALTSLDRRIAAKTKLIKAIENVSTTNRKSLGL